MAIHEWPEHLRPRERLLQQGPSVLNDAELLAIFLRVGIKGKSAIDLAKDMLTHFGSLHALLKADLNDWNNIPGIGPAKYAQLHACMELARRCLRENLKKPHSLLTHNDVAEFVGMKLRHQQVEQFLVLWMDNQLRLIHDAIMFTGTVGQTAAYPREVARKALALNASAVIVAHNHPSGTAEPSAADMYLTEQLGKSLKLIDVRLLDHLIVAGEYVISLRNRHDWPLP